MLQHSQLNRNKKLITYELLYFYLVSTNYITIVAISSKLLYIKFILSQVLHNFSKLLMFPANYLLNKLRVLYYLYDFEKGCYAYFFYKHV